jgi:hypothetical protein
MIFTRLSVLSRARFAGILFPSVLFIARIIARDIW